ncbi:TPA: hypothetical protein L5U90_003288 [Pseudomonas aeruginosa]|nr:hypothetical protein [Pseudomonas aeruginosa]
MFVTQVIFNIGERAYPDRARAMVAELMDGVQPGLVATLMNYIPGTSTSRTEFPTVQFGGASDGFSLLGFGDGGGAIVRDAVPLIHAALARRMPDRIIQVEHKEHSLSAEARPYVLRYTVPRMVVQKKQHHAERLLDEAEGKAHLEGLFLRSLQRQAAAVGLPLPENLEVEFKGAVGDFAAKQNPNSKVAHRGLRGAVFDVNARLGGIWTAGFMLSKGYGQFNATHQLSGAGNALSE